MYKIAAATGRTYFEDLRFESISGYQMWEFRVRGEFPEVAFEDPNGDVYFEGPDGPELTLEYIVD